MNFWLHGESQHLPTAIVRDRAAQLVKHLEHEAVSKAEGLTVLRVRLWQNVQLVQRVALGSTY